MPQVGINSGSYKKDRSDDVVHTINVGGADNLDVCACRGRHFSNEGCHVLIDVVPYD